MSLLASVLTAMVFAIFGFPFRYYHCWLSWSPVGANLGILVYLTLAGAGGGFIGWLVGSAAQADIGANLVVQGIFYGVAGTLAVRADFRSQRPRASREVREAASLLGKAIEWTTAALNDTTLHRARRWLDTLDDQTLAAAARDVSTEVEHMPGQQMSGAAKRSALQRLLDALVAMQSDPTHDDGRRRLIRFCAEFYVTQHMAKPALPRPTAASQAPAL